jgi:hypothetical protein
MPTHCVKSDAKSYSRTLSPTWGLFGVGPGQPERWHESRIGQDVQCLTVPGVQLDTGGRSPEQDGHDAVTAGLRSPYDTAVAVDLHDASR